MSVKALIFHISISCDKTFPWVLTDLTLEFDLLFENLNLANNLQIVCTRALIFHLREYSL